MNFENQILENFAKKAQQKFEEKIEEALKVWGINFKDAEQLKRVEVVLMEGTTRKELRVDGHTVLIFTDWSFSEPNLYSDNGETKISARFECSDIFPPLTD